MVVRISATIMSRLMFNLRDPKMLAPPSLRTRTTTLSDPMVSTFVDPYPTTTRIYDDEYILTEGDLNNPISMSPIFLTLLVADVCVLKMTSSLNPGIISQTGLFDRHTCIAIYCCNTNFI